jgi:hypothetical protein
LVYAQGMSAEVPLGNCIVILARNRGVGEPAGSSPGTGIKQATGCPPTSHRWGSTQLRSSALAVTTPPTCSASRSEVRGSRHPTTTGGSRNSRVPRPALSRDPFGTRSSDSSRGRIPGYIYFPTSAHSCTLWVDAITGITPVPTHTLRWVAERRVCIELVFA